MSYRINSQHLVIDMNLNTLPGKLGGCARNHGFNAEDPQAVTAQIHETLFGN
jgi:hypothetical protein